MTRITARIVTAVTALVLAGSVVVPAAHADTVPTAPATTTTATTGAGGTGLVLGWD